MGRKKSHSRGKESGFDPIRAGNACDPCSRRPETNAYNNLQPKEGCSIPTPGATPERKKGSGAPRKTSPRTDNNMKRALLLEPALTASELKKEHPDLLKDVSIRTIQHRLQKDLAMPSRRAANKPLFTKVMTNKRVAFAKKYRHFTPEDWKQVMFSDESTFRLIRGASNVVCRPKSVSRYHPKYTVKTVKLLDSVMVREAFSGNKGRGGLYFLPKNMTMKGSNYYINKSYVSYILCFISQKNLMYTFFLRPLYSPIVL